MKAPSPEVHAAAVELIRMWHFVSDMARASQHRAVRNELEMVANSIATRCALLLTGANTIGDPPDAETVFDEVVRLERMMRKQ